MTSHPLRRAFGARALNELDIPRDQGRAHQCRRRRIQGVHPAQTALPANFDRAIQQQIVDGKQCQHGMRAQPPGCLICGSGASQAPRKRAGDFKHDNRRPMKRQLLSRDHIEKSRALPVKSVSRIEC